MLAAIFARLLTAVVSAISEPLDVRTSRGRLRRVLILLVLIAVLCLLPLRLSPHSARVVAGVVLAVVALGLLSTVACFRRLLARLADGETLRLGGRALDVPSLGREVQAFEATMALARRAGLALPALLFFCIWAVVYIFIWAHDPAACPADPAHPCAGAFLGAGPHPTFGDFLYYSVNMAFANPAPDLIANTRVAHTAATIEVLSGVGLVTLFAAAFFGLGAAAKTAPAQGGEGGAAPSDRAEVESTTERPPTPGPGAR